MPKIYKTDTEKLNALLVDVLKIPQEISLKFCENVKKQPEETQKMILNAFKKKTKQILNSRKEAIKEIEKIDQEIIYNVETLEKEQADENLEKQLNE